MVYLFRFIKDTGIIPMHFFSSKFNADDLIKWDLKTSKPSSSQSVETYSAMVLGMGLHYR